jgi:RND family efflux transporter MFP subunit
MSMEEMKKKKTYGFLMLIVILAVVTGAGCRGKPEEKGIMRPAVSGVTVSSVSLSQADEVHQATGTIHSAVTSVISGRVMGMVTMLKVKEGDFVRKGQELLTIDDRDAVERVRGATMAVEAARQNLALSETTWKRYRGLYEKQALAKQEMDRVETQKNVAEADYQRARAVLNESRTNLTFTRITAPMDGVIISKKIDAGSMTVPGTPLLVLEGAGDEYVEIALDESLSRKVKEGMPVAVRVDALDRTLQSHVREVVPSVDPASRTFIVKVGLEGQDLRPGLFVRVSLPVGKKQVIVVPEKAVVRKGELTGVYAVDTGGVVTYRLIRTGSPYPGGLEVLSGLSPDEKIITDGVDRAQDGGIVR